MRIICWIFPGGREGSTFLRRQPPRRRMKISPAAEPRRHKYTLETEKSRRTSAEQTQPGVGSSSEQYEHWANRGCSRSKIPRLKTPPAHSNEQTTRGRLVGNMATADVMFDRCDVVLFGCSASMHVSTHTALLNASVLWQGFGVIVLQLKSK